MSNSATSRTVACQASLSFTVSWSTQVHVLHWVCCHPSHPLPPFSFAFSLSVQFSSVTQSCPLFATPWTAAHQASLSITNSRSPPKPMSIEPVMPSNHLIVCCPLLLLPSSFPSIRVFSNESALCIRWPKYWSFSFNIRQWTPRTYLYRTSNHA